MAEKKKKRMSVKKLCTYGLLIALAFVLSYLESFIPNVMPGMKLGLANIVVMVALYVFGARDAFILSMIRIILVSFTFGNTVSMLYSLAGGILSYIVMVILKKTNLFNMVTVSIAGGIFHNVGQILMAAFILKNMGVMGYLPILFVSGAVTGVLIGILGGEVAKRIRKAALD